MPDININRQTVISFPNNSQLEDITTGIESGSLLLDEILCEEGFTIGQCCANRFEVDLHNIPDIEKEYIYVYQNVIEGSSVTEVPLFHGRVDSCKRNRSREDISRHIIAYDALYYLSDTDITPYWNEVFTNSSTITLKNLRDGLCDYVGMEYVSTTLPNDNLVISKTQNINNVSFIGMLRYICAIQACNANINREGKLEFIASYSTYDVTDNYEKNTSEFESFQVPVFSQVYISNSIRDTEARAGDGTKIICIQDNILVLDRTSAELETIAQTILDSVAKVQYSPATINLIVSDYDAKLGKLIHTDLGNSLVCENVMKGVMLVNQTLTARGKEDYEEQSTISGYTYSVTDEDLKVKTKVLAEEYYLYNNENEITVGDGQTKDIVNITFVSTGDTNVTFHAEILLDVSTTVSGITYNDAVGKVTYYINDSPVSGYKPTETWVDGKHILHLLYYMQITGARAMRFRATLNMAGGNVVIQAEGMQASIRGQGLMSSEEWSGFIDFRENIRQFEFGTITLNDNIVDTVDVDVEAPIDISFEEELHEIEFGTITLNDSFTEMLLIDKQAMSNFEHGQLTPYTHEDLHNGFIYG